MGEGRMSESKVSITTIRYDSSRTWLRSVEERQRALLNKRTETQRERTYGNYGSVPEAEAIRQVGIAQDSVGVNRLGAKGHGNYPKGQRPSSDKKVD